MATPLLRESEYVEILSRLTLNRLDTDAAVRFLSTLNAQEREDLVSLANSHHVIVRALTPVLASTIASEDLKNWAAKVILTESERISNALFYLQEICNRLERGGCKVTVMKSLDHWPDLGNDLDLYTTTDERQVQQILIGHFKAKIEPRSWGDRLAHKWNFAIPGLPEAIEVHAQRLGQTGEHTLLAQRFVTRRVIRTLEHRSFFVPAPEERIVVATLQRMYRHFYFRICDIANTAALVQAEAIDFRELKASTEPAGIWPGVATYLAIVSDHVKRYQGTPLELPEEVIAAACFGGDVLRTRARFLRVPLMPHGARLYTHQVKTAAFNGDVPATFRLSLLPPLASAAVVAFKLTGSDKGVW